MPEYQGDEFIYAVVTVQGDGSTTEDTLVRPFNQTGGSSTLETSEIELNSKDSDKVRVKPGKVKETLSLEGILTEGDAFIDFIKSEIRARNTVEIYEINTRTKEAESGFYVITNFERTYTNGEFSTYSLEATLDGDVTSTILTEIPTGVQQV